MGGVLTCAGSLITSTRSIHEAGFGVQTVASLGESEALSKIPWSLADRAHSLPAGRYGVVRIRRQQLGVHQWVAVEAAAQVVRA